MHVPLKSDHLDFLKGGSFQNIKLAAFGILDILIIKELSCRILYF